MARQERSYIGKGPCYIVLYGATKHDLPPMGNAEALTFSFEQEDNVLPDSTTAGGGARNKVTRVSDVTGTLTLTDYTSENLALALRGTIVAEAAGQVTDEAHPTQGGEGNLIPFSHQYDPAQPVTIKLTDDTECLLGRDYTLGNSGIILLNGSNIAANGIKASYTRAESEILEAMTTSALEYRIFYDGLNEAQGGKAFNADVFRVKFDPVQDLGLIADDFGRIPLTFSALNDPTKTGTGLSRTMKVRQRL